MREDVEMPFGEHLEELRRRVIYALLGLVVAAIFCGVNYKFLLTALIRPYKHAYDQMVARRAETEQPTPEPPETPKVEEPAVAPGSPLALILERLKTIEERQRHLEERLDVIAPEAKISSEASKSAAYVPQFPLPQLTLRAPMTGYVTIIMLCIICGIILASPWILYQIWAFVGVGLHPHERRFVYMYGPFSFLLFIAGGATFYFALLPVGLQALMGPTGNVLIDNIPMIKPDFLLDEYFKFVALLTLVFGVVFQTPLVVMFIAWTEIVPLRTLVKQQRIVIVVMFLLGAVFTPPDPVTQIMMAVPMVILYELGLVLAWITLRRKRKREAEEGESDWWGDDEPSPPSAPAGGEGAATPPAEEPQTGEADDTGTTGETFEPESYDEYHEEDLYDYERDYGEGEDAEHEDPYASIYGDEHAEEQPYDDGYPPGQYHYEEEGEDQGLDESAASEEPKDSAPPESEPPPDDEGEAEEGPADQETPDAEEPTEPPLPDFDADLPPEDRMK